MRWKGLNRRYGMARDGMGLMRRDKLKGRDGMGWDGMKRKGWEGRDWMECDGMG